MSLTDTHIRKLRLLETERIDLGDGKVPGLMLRATGKGTRTWSLLFRVKGEGGKSPNGRLRPGKQRRMTLGRYPYLSLSEARRKALVVLAEAEAGHNPITIPANTDTLTIISLVERFTTEGTQGLRRAHAIRRTLEVHVIPRWGERSAAEITAEDARMILREVIQPDKNTRRGGPGAAADVRKCVSRMFNWARQEGLLDHNPFDRVKSPVRVLPRERILNREELLAVWNAAGAISYPFGPIHQLLILTGQRLREIAHARWTWIDEQDKTLQIPGSFYKNGRPHIVPLTPAAWAIIEKLPRWAGGDHLFSTDGGQTPVCGFSNAKERLDKVTAAELEKTGLDPDAMEPWVVHDLRRTVRSGLSRLGVDIVTAELVIGHKLKGVVGVYDRYERLMERRAALELWERELVQTSATTP
jgi:integrase